MDTPPAEIITAEVVSPETDIASVEVMSVSDMEGSQRIELPDYCVVVLIGVSGSGKSTFARRHFLDSEILSSDAFRALVSDDENDQGATRDAFDALHYVAATRLRRRKLIVIDATNVQPEARKPLVELAQAHDCLCVALILDVPERVCQERNKLRADRQFGPHVIANQGRQLRQSLRNLRREGFRYTHTLSPAQLESVQISRIPLWTDRRAESGPFDIIGDVHGCGDELRDLLARLGYAPDSDMTWRHPQNRRAIFLGDLVDRGPQVVEVVELAQRMMRAGTGLCVPGNHDNKLMRALQGKRVQVTHGLAESLAQIEALPPEHAQRFKAAYIQWADSLVSHYWLDGGALCVAHAGMKEAYIGRASGRVREFALYGETTGETDAFGLPIRVAWAQEYRGRTTVVYGHTPTPEPEWLNNTINLDTGCVFGGKLTALRWPEREIVSVPARAAYAEAMQGNREQGTGNRQAALAPSPISEQDAPDYSAVGDASIADTLSATQASTVSCSLFPVPSLQWQHDELLHAEDVLGKRTIETRLLTHVTIPAANAGGALEVMSRFAVEPRWLIYLPPTMSPCETAPIEENGQAVSTLERPQEAFAYYRGQGARHVVCQRKHMGSRAVVVVCRDEEAAHRRFGATDGTIGVCYTRTGRQFFDDADWNRALLTGIQNALGQAGFWDEFATDWICLDCELMPWNAKAQGLLREQYAPVGASAKLSLDAALQAVTQGVGRGLPLGELAATLRQRQEDAAGYTQAYGHYCWNVGSVDDIRLAPFHLLATEGQTYFDRDHAWHIATLSRLAEHSPLFTATQTLRVDVEDAGSQAEGAAWWEELTGAGGEGMVVKPLEWIMRGPKGLAQPAVKARGREYLRIIYGPEYTEPANLNRLRQRGLGTKRSLALREFALGVEGLERFVRREPLRRVHECAFGVLALESEPVDPRL